MTFAVFTHRLGRLFLDVAGTPALAVIVLALGPQAAAHAQAPQVSPQPSVTLYRAFYFDANDNLQHIEEVRSVASRVIQPLPPRTIKAPPASPLPGPPDPGEAVLIGPMSYAIYYGLDASDPIPAPGTQSTLRPLAGVRVVPARA